MGRPTAEISLPLPGFNHPRVPQASYRPSSSDWITRDEWESAERRVVGSEGLTNGAAGTDTTRNGRSRERRELWDTAVENTTDYDHYVETRSRMDYGMRPSSINDTRFEQTRSEDSRPETRVTWSRQAPAIVQHTGDTSYSRTGRPPMTSRNFPTPQRQKIRLGAYDGKGAIETFLRKFELCAKNNDWSDEDRLTQLSCALLPPCDQLLWEMDEDEDNTWQDLVSKLRSRYGSADQIALYQTQLGLRRQREGEDIPALADDVRRLMLLGYPGRATPHSEGIATRAFLDALTDRKLALKIREREPADLEAAYRLALRLDGYRQAEEASHRENDRNGPGTKVVEGNDSMLKELVKRMELLEKTCLKDFLMDKER